MKRLKILIPFLIIMLLLTGCQSSAITATTNTAAVAVAAAGLTAVVPSTSTIAVDPEFSDRDLKTTYDDSTAVHVTMDGTNIQVSGDGATASGGVLTISKEGVYVVTGSLSDGQIVVAADTDKVQIVLNGVTINCADNAPIYIESANKVFITLGKDTVNTLTDGSAYVQTDENTVDSVIFSKADLTINGEGTLNITANYKHAIVSKDDLVITGGTYNITSVKDALSSKNCVKIKDGVINITSATGKGITSKNDEDNTKGYVYICGGTIKITNSVEGIEGTAIIVEGGTIDITSQDDGFNAADGITTTTTNSNGPGGGAMEADANCYLTISGGTININATGDGIDSNGNLYISGGTIDVSGPTANDNGALDYNGTAEITGGTIIAAGSSRMAQGFSDTSTQYSLLNNFTTACTSGTEVTLTDASGNIIVSYTPVKTYQSVVISAPALQKGTTYTLTCGSQTTDITLTSVTTSNGQATGMGDGQNGGTRPQ